MSKTIISVYNKNKPTSYISYDKTKDLLVKTNLRSKAKVFNNEAEAKSFLKSKGYKWLKAYSVDEL
jgi:hypothetical protein